MSLYFRSNSAFKWHFSVSRESTDKDAPVLAEVSLAMARTRATVTIGDHEIEMTGKGWFFPTFTFVLGGKVLATGGVSAAFFRTRMWLESGERRFDVVSSKLGMRLEISEHDKVVGRVQRHGMFHRRGEIDLPAGVPVHDQLFILTIAMYHWRQLAAAAS